MNGVVVGRCVMFFFCVFAAGLEVFRASLVFSRIILSCRVVRHDGH